MIKKWFKSGDPWIWLNASAVSTSIIIVVGLLLLIAVRGLSHFWPAQVIQAELVNGEQRITLIGEIVETEEVPIQRLLDSGINIKTDKEFITRTLLKVGNRDKLGSDFRWVIFPDDATITHPKNLVQIERREWGNFYGYIKNITKNGERIVTQDTAWQQVQPLIDETNELHDKIRDIEKNEIGDINYQLERLRLERRKFELKGITDKEALDQISAKEAFLYKQYEEYKESLAVLYKEIATYAINAEIMDGQSVVIPLSKIVRAYQPNALTLLQKISTYFSKLSEFVFDDPREANTEGGIFPAIFGTVLMVILMAILVTPCGVIAAIYLREYAKQGLLTRLIRIAVNNLAGVPSIVYGIFGLGFFIYFLGSEIDQLFFPEALPTPTFGTPGILWSSLTLAILTVPVVIVATEEGLSRIPKALREGSLALGATKAETLWHIIIPMATPSMMTGMILAIARAAGEVAPLMLVGVVKLAPSLPLDGSAPFLHLDRKFMHLGFHIYDVGFQSPNVEAARPLVYATSFLLVLVIVILNLAAIWIRNNLREKYRNLDS
ncbi:Phosphate transport system permease protein PstA (TC 3.A.1.7.1) [hydrothermal vent metagenome]|uniref:Phosphate transport system permease protein PstA (TC 3.A.1.7.1) n=1 Tax=hydrothermal vent metagenome TaxID=652676 RepID=A0A3B1ATJ1_9ZZZZ